MGTLRRRLRDARAGVVRDDEGTTLIELVVGMTIMGVFLAIFTVAMVSMASTVNKVEAVTTSSGQINTAFLKLDKLVRYASAITTTGKGTSGDWYVELDSVNSDTSVESCTQLRVDIASQQLQQRTWNVPASAPTTYTALSNWTMLANQITNGGAASGSADQPFTVPTALTNAATSFQRLTVTLVAAAGAAGSTSTTRTSLSFTSLNSTAGAATNATKCQQVNRP